MALGISIVFHFHNALCLLLDLLHFLNKTTLLPRGILIQELQRLLHGVSPRQVQAQFAKLLPFPRIILLTVHLILQRHETIVLPLA